MGLRESSVFRLACTLTGQGRSGGPQRGQSQGREAGGEGAESIPWGSYGGSCVALSGKDNNSINNNNNGIPGTGLHLPGIASLIPLACGGDYLHSHFTGKNTEAWSTTPGALASSPSPLEAVCPPQVPPSRRIQLSPTYSRKSAPTLPARLPVTPAGPPLELTPCTKHLHILLFIGHLA